MPNATSVQLAPFKGGTYKDGTIIKFTLDNGTQLSVIVMFGGKYGIPLNSLASSLEHLVGRIRTEINEN